MPDVAQLRVCGYYSKRPDGRYATTVITGYKDNGKPIRKTLYGRTIREPDDKFSEFKALRAKGIIINDKNITFGDWADKWLEAANHITPIRCIKTL